MSDRVSVAPCRFGRGVFANTPILEGDEILRFSGPLIDLPAALALGDRECDPLQIGPQLYMAIGAPGVLVNHSCEPNAGIVDDSILIALRDIPQGEEIFYDYSTTIEDDPWTFTCACGHDTCRGTIGEFRHLSDDRRDHYLRLRIVQTYIAEQFTRRSARRAPVAPFTSRQLGSGNDASTQLVTPKSLRV